MQNKRMAELYFEVLNVSNKSLDNDTIKIAQIIAEVISIVNNDEGDIIRMRKARYQQLKKGLELAHCKTKYKSELYDILSGCLYQLSKAEDM